MTGADDLKALVRTIPDFPKPGIQYRDITTLLLDRVGLPARSMRLRRRSTGRSIWSRQSKRVGSLSAARWR